MTNEPMSSHVRTGAAPLEGNDPFGMRRFSLRRYTVRHLLYMLIALVVVSVVTARLAGSGDWTTLSLAATGLALMGMIFALSFRATVKRIVVEQWIRRLGMGDFEYRLEPKGNTEVDKMLVALENVRQEALKAMQLDLVRTLSEELQVKNDELEQAMGELRQAQDRLVSQQKLEELHDMTVAIAHELNNPLNLALNFSELSAGLVAEIVSGVDEFDLSEDAKEGIRELLGDLDQSIQRAVFNCGRASEVVQEVLKLGDARRGDYRRSDLNQLVRDHVAAAYEVARQGGRVPEMMIVEDFDPSAGEMWVVPEDLGRLVAHVADNAFAAALQKVAEGSDDGYGPRLEVSTVRSGDQVEIRFHDNGVGIPEDVLPLIFNPFFTTRPTGQGVGLGLSLSYDVVREHGGTVTVRSEPGQHTEVTVSLPDHGRPIINEDPVV